MSTRDKIVTESLALFSQKGYDGVSVREIAAAVGIKGASLYNHFKGKEDIFQAIFEEMIKRYDDAAAMMDVPMEQGSETVDSYMKMDEQQMLVIAENLFSFFTVDKFTSLFRKLLMSEQHRSELAADSLNNYYFVAPIAFQAQLFRSMQRRGAFENYDAETMALHFYSPIYYLLCRYDLGYSYEDCIEQIAKHIHWFCQLYQKE